MVLFVATYLVVKWLEAISQRACAALRLKGLDHILGLGVGVAEGLIVVYGFLVLAQVQTLIDTGPWFADSLVQERLPALDARQPAVSRTSGAGIGHDITAVFENIIGHHATTTVLCDEVAADRLPRAILLSGPAYSGKLSIALELARVLACTRTGDWGCECQVCLRHRDLGYPYLLLLGWRYWEAEIRAAADLLQRSQSAACYHFFVRAVRKLTRRYDGLLWEGDETRLRPAAGPVGRAERAAGRAGAGADGGGAGEALRQDRDAGGQAGDDRQDGQCPDQPDPQRGAMAAPVPRRRAARW